MSRESESSQSESAHFLARIIPEVLFDLLGRVVPGVAFLSLMYFSIYPGTRTLAVPINSIYQLLFLVVAGYLAGFILEILSLAAVVVFQWLLDPAAAVFFGSDRSWASSRGRRLARQITRLPLFDPLDAQLMARVKKAVHDLLATDISADNAAEVMQTIFDHIKLRVPALAAVLLKIHAEAFMFKNLMTACLVALMAEVAVHSLEHRLYLAGLLVVSVVSCVAFVYLSFLGCRRIYQSFLAVVTTDTSS